MDINHLLNGMILQVFLAGGGIWWGGALQFPWLLSQQPVTTRCPLKASRTFATRWPGTGVSACFLWWEEKSEGERHLTLRIQSPCQMMIRVYSHLPSKVFKVPLPFSEGEPGSLGVQKDWRFWIQGNSPHKKRQVKHPHSRSSTVNIRKFRPYGNPSREMDSLY